MDNSRSVVLTPWVEKIVHHPKCKLQFDAHNGDYGCEYHSTLSCDDCKYGVGRRDPEAQCNQLTQA